MFYRFTFLIICLCLSMTAIGQTSLEGKVSDESTGEPILFGTVALYKSGVLVTGTETDLDGNYIFGDLDPGTYDIEVSYVGYQTQRISDVVAKAGQINKVDVVIAEGSGVTLDEIKIVAYKEPLVDFDNTTQGGTVTADEIRSLPAKQISAIAATTAGVSTVDGGDISMRGSRTDGTYYYIDGVRVSSDNINNLVPQSEIDQLQVITGGIEAKYGDVTGGIISITTKGPSEKFTGGLEVETSEFLDPYGYNLLSANVSGPLLKNKEDNSILGFRLFGQYRNIDDFSPSAVGHYRMSEEMIRQLEENPVSSLNGTAIPTAETLVFADAPEPLKTAPNETLEDYSVTAKIDARISSAVDVTVSGGYYQTSDQYTPFSDSGIDPSNRGNPEWAMYNWVNNPFRNTDGYRGNFRFRHKLGRQGFTEGEEDAEEASIFRNASYTIQGGYEKRFVNLEDNNHGDNLFRHGYYGRQDRDWVPVGSILTSPDDWEGPITTTSFGLPLAHQGYEQQLGEGTPDLTYNPAQARINAEGPFIENGFQNDVLNNVWALFYNVGKPFNRFYKEEEDRYTVNVSSGFDLLPGGSEKGKHSIQFGFTYEQRTLRQWTLAPEALWTLARLQSNVHIIGIDPTVVIDSFYDPNFDIWIPQHPTNIQPEDFADNLFFRKVREISGASLNEYVNVDELTPDQLSLSMFSASELNNYAPIGLNYYGYDYLGNKLDNTSTFNEFFTGRDADGRRRFDVPALQPIYWAGYLQDKFKYKDIIVRLGLRMDYYDANTKVLKDPYSPYEIETVLDYEARTGANLGDAVGDDYRVYVASDDSDAIVGFRQGDQWFAPNGTSLSGGNLLFGGGIVYPSYKERDPQKRRLTDPDFNPDISFEDYTPQFNLMPRVAFSFPISDDAGFFAHYDVLVQRPPSNVGGTALDYFFMENPQRFGTSTVPADNPDLRPEKTIDYEVGFQSKLTNSSALKISAYYKENRDMIQQRFYTNLPPPLNSYTTFGNLDFGTVKGFSFTYDLRRTGNIQMSTSYTLQFANGSGSDANSSSGINENGVIRELFPLSFDERHRIAATLDYRFSDGKAYNGPRIAGIDLLANAGANFIFTAVSGRPYNQYELANQPFSTPIGLQTINEARRPWIYNIDLRLDKQFKLNLSETSKKSLNFNVYLRFENLLNTMNVIRVFRATGDPDNEGYLLLGDGATLLGGNPNGLNQLDNFRNSGRNVDSYLANYAWRLLSPGHFARPRRIYLGLVFDF